MPELTDQPVRRERSMLGFYIAIGVAAVLVTLGAAAWKPLYAACRQRTTTQAFLRALDRRVTVDMKDVPAAEGLDCLEGVLDVSVVLPPHDNEGPVPMARVTLEFKDAPVGAVLDSWCRQTSLDWTIAALDRAPAKYQVVVDTPERIAELERTNPWASELVRQYRKELAGREKAR